MTSYWDYLARSLKNPITSGPAAFLHALYDKSYDNSHGASRYWHLALGGPLALNRYMRDSAKSAQDTYDNTGKDSPYAYRYTGPGLGSAFGLAAGAGGITGMARSLADVYGFEVSENVNPRSPTSYIR